MREQAYWYVTCNGESGEISTFQSLGGRSAHLGNIVMDLVDYWPGSGPFTFIWAIECQHSTK